MSEIGSQGRAPAMTPGSGTGGYAPAEAGAVGSTAAVEVIIDSKYRLIRQIGTGGMGVVYEGEDLRLHRKVAIKVLHASVASDRETLARFEREASAAGRIGSEHICAVLDIGSTADGGRYLALEYLEGETLGDRLKRTKSLSPLEAAALMLQILDALQSAHDANIIHRDLKPDNIFIVHSKGGQRDFVKVLDFGVSKFSALATTDMTQTRAGMVVGTPYYMSPEQAQASSSVDARSDIYALGVLLFQSVAGRVPFAASTFSELLFKIALETPPLPESLNPRVDGEFSRIIQTAMARNPEERFQSCTAFAQALVAWFEQHQNDLAAPSQQSSTGNDKPRLPLPTLPGGAHAPNPAMHGTPPPPPTLGASGVQPTGLRQTNNGGFPAGPARGVELARFDLPARADGGPRPATNALETTGAAFSHTPRPHLPERKQSTPVLLMAFAALLAVGAGAALVVLRPDPSPAPASPATQVAVPTAVQPTAVTPPVAPPPVAPPTPVDAAPPPTAAPATTPPGTSPPATSPPVLVPAAAVTPVKAATPRPARPRPTPQTPVAQEPAKPEPTAPKPSAPKPATSKPSLDLGY
jgi:serine/threonine protein kinase